MFSFHHHLPEQTASELHRWALTLAIYDRLSAHGMPPALYRNKTNPVYPPLLLHTGNEWIGPTGPIDPDELNPGNFMPLARENASNAASWADIPSAALPEAIKDASAQVNLAIEMSIARWLKLPDSQKHPHSLEARLWAAQQNGFDVFSIYYHETSAENAPSLLKNGFDFHRGKARLSDDGMPDGAFFKPGTESLELCEAPVQIPFILKKGKTLRVTHRDDILAMMREHPGIQILKMQIENTDKRERERFDDLMSELKKNPKSEPLKEQLDNCLQEWKAEIRRLATSVRQLFTAELKSQGVRYLHVSQDHGTWGRTVQSTVALYAEDICPADAKHLPKPDMSRITQPAVSKESLLTDFTDVVAQRGLSPEHMNHEPRMLTRR
jgi:hypothetical protein